MSDLGQLLPLCNMGQQLHVLQVLQKLDETKCNGWVPPGVSGRRGKGPGTTSSGAGCWK